MTRYITKFFCILVLATVFFETPIVAQAKKGAASAKAKVAVSKKKKGLTAAEKKELKAAQEVLKVMTSYHKGKFTRLFNSGSKIDLMALPGVGEKTAARIMDGRPYESSAHVVLEKGIGVEMFKKFVNARK